MQKYIILSALIGSLILLTSPQLRAEVYLIDFNEHNAEFLMLQEINSLRYSHGLPLVTPDDRMSMVSRRHALDMARNDYFDHFTPDGISPDDRARMAGLPYDIYENIGIIKTYGQDTAEVVSALMKGFMESPSHRANLLDPRLTHVGIGFYQDVDGKNGRLRSGTDPSKVYRGYGTVLVVQDFYRQRVSLLEPVDFTGITEPGEFLTLTLDFDEEVEEAFIRIFPESDPIESYEVPLCRLAKGFRARFAIDYEGNFTVAIYAAKRSEEWFYREQGRFELCVKSHGHR